MDDFSTVITVGKKDCEELKGLHGTAGIEFIPNGVDPEHFAFSPTGYVPDIRRWGQRALVAVRPIRFGSGIKNKMLEWMSVGRLVVSTSLGAEKIEAVHRQDILIADDAESFARTVLELMQDLPCSGSVWPGMPVRS